MRILVVFLFAAAVLSSQSQPTVTVTFTRQEGMTVGKLQGYAANVCNVGTLSGTVQSIRDVWPEAQGRNLTPQARVSILQAERSEEHGSRLRWILWGAAGGCAIASAVTNGGAVALDPSRGIGKAVAYSTAGCAIGLPIVAERFTQTPGPKVPVPYDDLLPPVFVLGAGDCKQGFIYAAMPLGLQIIP